MNVVEAETGMINNPETKKYNEVKKGYTYFENNDVIFAKITPCMQNGKSAIAKDLVNNIGFGSTEFHVIRPTNDVLPEWLHFYLRQKYYLFTAVNFMQGSVGQQRLPEDYLYNTFIPLPSITEQEKYISLLSRKQEKINNIKKYFNEQISYINAFPSAILRQAFEGKL
jgi:type I restriction enzyme S subunit